MGVYPGTSMEIRGNKELCFIWVLISTAELVHGYSVCSSGAKAASLPAALLCYDNQVSGERVIIDGYLAKESNNPNCRCTVTSNETGVLNISNYNGNHPEADCGSSLLFEAGGVSFPMNCFVSNIQLSDDGPGASVSLGNPQLADNTDYCISIQSGNSAAVLNVSCWGDPLPSTSTTEFPPPTEEIEASSSSLTTSGHLTITNTPNHASSTKEDISNTSTTTASWNFSTSTQSSATTNEPVTYSHSSTVLPRSSQTVPTSSEASPRTEQKTSQTFSTGVTSSSTSPSTSSSSDVSLITTFSTMTSTIDQTTLSDTTTDETLTISSDSTSVPLQTPETGTSTDALSTPTTEISMQTMTTISTPASTSTQTPSTSGDQNATTFSSTSKTNTVTVSEPRPQADRGTQWSLIIPAILLGIILFFALMFAFIKWKRSLEIKYPSEDHAPLHYNTPGGHTNIGYDAFVEGPEIITEFTKSPENRELDSIVLENITENEPEPNNQTKGAFIRYDVKDYQKGRNSPDKTIVKREPNGPDIYF